MRDERFNGRVAQLVGVADDSHGWGVRTNQMRGNQEANDRFGWGQWHRRTSVVIPPGSAFRLGDRGIRGGLEPCLDRW